MIMTMCLSVFLVQHVYAEEKRLKDMHMEDSNELKHGERTKDSYGNSYSGNIVNMESSRNSYAVYNLDASEYARFSGK